MNQTAFEFVADFNLSEYEQFLLDNNEQQA
jgi:hypothetical protein